GINDIEKRKTVKVGISSANLPDTMLTHDDGRVRVVQQVACEVRSFSENLLRDHRMSLRGYQYAETWGGKDRLDEAPSLRDVPGLAHDPRMGCHAQEFVENRPGRIPGIRASFAGLRASPGSRHETANRHRPHTQEYSCLRGALAPFHGLIQPIP